MTTPEECSIHPGFELYECPVCKAEVDTFREYYARYAAEKFGVQRATRDTYT